MARNRGLRKPAARSAVRRSEAGAGELAPVVPLRRAATRQGERSADADLEALRAGCDEMQQRIAALGEVVALLQAARDACRGQGE